MNVRYFLFLICIVSTLSIQAPAKTNCKKKTNDKIRLIEATSQTTVAGIPGQQSKTAYRFIIVWQGAKYPETFFWRGDNGWLTCSMQKAHKVKSGKGYNYTSEFVSGDGIHKGDMLELIPMTGGKFPVPAEIPVEARNTLYYKTAGSGWLAFPVKTITKKVDILRQ
jgi:hypothetical protein